jgi:WhiB family transcriptional regulator, redox-sensing transcriptional regulator
VSEFWREEALCRQIDVGDVFFPSPGESTRAAKQICLDCPVRAQCLSYALKRNEPFGVWGGLSERERRRVRRGEQVPVLKLQPCGTVAAFQRHVRDGETPCEPCREAKNDASRRWAQAQARRQLRARSLGEVS